MKRPKISLVGAGNIGGTLAYLVGLKELGDCALIDITEGIPQGKALDIAQASSIEGFNELYKGSNSFEDLKGSDIVIVTAGVPRKTGVMREERLDIITKNIGPVGKLEDPHY